MKWHEGEEKWFVTQFDLIIVIIVAIIAAVSSIYIEFVERVYELFVSHATIPAIRFVLTEIMVLLLGLLWIAYRRWYIARKKRIALENILDSISPDALLIVDIDRNILMCNRSVERIFGYTEDEVIGKKTDILYEDRRSQTTFTHEIYEILERDGFHIGEARGKTKNGDTIALEIITGNISGREGAVILIRDITDRKLREQELQQTVKDLETLAWELNVSKANFQNIVKKIFEGIVLVDQYGIARLTNPIAERYLNKKSEEIIGKPFDFPLWMHGTREIVITRQNGEKGIGEMISIEAEWENQNANLVLIRDVTELREAEHAREMMFMQFEKLLENIRKKSEPVDSSDGRELN